MCFIRFDPPLPFRVDRADKYRSGVGRSQRPDSDDGHPLRPRAPLFLRCETELPLRVFLFRGAPDGSDSGGTPSLWSDGAKRLMVSVDDSSWEIIPRSRPSSWIGRRRHLS